MTYVAHLSKTAGQIVNVDTKVRTLSDYIKQVEKAESPVPKKLTFDEYYKQNPPGRFWTTGEFEDYLQLIWKAAQDNM